MRKTALLGLLLAACQGQVGDTNDGTTHDPFSSALATLLDFEFDGDLLSTSATSLSNQVHAQLLYTIGSINAEPGVPRLSKVVLTNLSAVSAGGGLYRIRYHAKLPVAWGHKDNLPSSYTFTLPHRVDATGQSQFTAKYGPSCNDGEPDSVTVANYWYHYRPHASGCSLAAADVVSMKATATRDLLNTDGKYPEYQQVWADGALRVLAVFAKYATGATSNDDAGIDAFNQFVAAVRAEYPSATVSPANLPSPPGVTHPDVTVTVQLAGGTVEIVALLVDSVPTAGATFNTRYAQLTPGADLILYNGHAGLGANVAALSKLGNFFPDTYQIIMMNGCDTFAYVDDTLLNRRLALNPTDKTGTKYMDVVANAMPAYFNALPDTSMALIRALTQIGSPLTYDQIFAQVDPSQVIVVTGDEDNQFTPGFDPGSDWNGFHAEGTVGYKQVQTYHTDTLQPGTYAFTMVPNWSASGGDGDLRIAVGSAVPQKCPSYVKNSNERCLLKIGAPAALTITATGDSSALAAYVIDGWQE